jgi:hypothetical protein
MCRADDGLDGAKGDGTGPAGKGEIRGSSTVHWNEPSAMGPVAGSRLSASEPSFPRLPAPPSTLPRYPAAPVPRQGSNPNAMSGARS